MDIYVYYWVGRTSSNFEDKSHTCHESVSSSKEVPALHSEGNISSVSRSLDNEESTDILSRRTFIEISNFVAFSDINHKNYSLSGFDDDSVNDGLHNSLFSDDKDGFIMKVQVLMYISYSLLKAIQKKMFVNKSSPLFPFPRLSAEISLFDITKEVRNEVLVVVMSRWLEFPVGRYVEKLLW